MSSMKLKYSTSNIGAYMMCPRKFKLQYIDKKTFPKPKHLLEGVELHGWYDKFYKELPPMDELDNNHFDTYSKIFPQELREKYNVDLYNFLEFNKKIFLKANGNKVALKPLATEEKFYDENLNFVGVIDAVFTDGENYLVLDFKTGKPKDKLTESYQFQLCGYKHLWDLRYPDQKITHWGNLFTKGEITDINPIIEKVSPEAMLNFYNTLDEMKIKIEAGIFNKTCNTFWCKRCEAAIYCYGDIETLKEGWQC